MMKRIFFVLVAWTIIAAGCNVVDNKIRFNMAYDESVIIPSSTVVDLPVNILTPDITSNAESTFASNNTNKEFISGVYLNSMTLTVVDPATEDFSFLESIIIYMAADGLPEIQVAWNENIEETTSNTLSLTTTDDDLQEYIKKDDFKLRVKTVTDEVISEDHQIDMDISMSVDAVLFGE